jgi:hypothetical protein
VAELNDTSRDAYQKLGDRVMDAIAALPPP